MEQYEQMKHKLDMLDKIYNMREEELELENKQDRKNLNGKLNEVKLEDIEETIKNKLDKIDKNTNINEREEIIKKIEQLIENYEIQIAYYSEKNYKRGFKDAFLLYSQCVDENN